MLDLTKKIDISKITQTSSTEVSIPQPDSVISLDSMNDMMSSLVQQQTIQQNMVDTTTAQIASLQSVIDAAIAVGVQTQSQIDASQQQVETPADPAPAI
jgi:hypothetical protein